MGKNIKIFQSPFHSPLEVAEGIVIKISAPYSETSVTVEANPFIQDYQENADKTDIKVRQIMLTTTTDHTKKLLFDLKGVRKHQVTVETEQYEINLTNIGKEEIQGQKFLFYEFSVSKG